jgi:hypothetical protein
VILGMFGNWLIIYSLRLGLEVLLYPLFYHAALQRLGPVPARPLLPSWTSLIPFSSSSPLLPLSLHYDVTASPMDCLKALLTSPVVLLCLEHFIERWISVCIHEAIETSIIRPENPDVQSQDVLDEGRMLTDLGLRRQSPSLVRKVISKMLILLGWSHRPDPHDATQQRAIGIGDILYSNQGQTMEVGSTRVTNISRLDVPVVQTHDQVVAEPLEPDVLTIPIDAVEEMIRFITPPTTPGSGLDHDENDPRIRITSREGVVEMEVRLPTRVISTHTEVVDAMGSSSDGITSRNGLRSSHNSLYHRVTQLSREPAQMISQIFRAQLVGLAMLPIKIVTLRMIASHYLATRVQHVGPHRIVIPLGLSNNFSWPTIGVQLSRVALCGALELATDLGLWGLQYCTITKFGKELFGWGTL